MAETPMDPSTAAPESPTSGDVVREQDKIMLVLAYLGIFCLFPLLTVKDSEYVKWHAKQGLALMIVWIAWAIVGGILNFIPVAGTCVYLLGYLGLLIVSVMAIMKAFAPLRWEIPVVSAIAKKF
ncbi:MAG TPA: DUF4870 domain-containing protein [Myxococcales bacterium]|jgi:uncharacterized membrane protein